MDEPTRQQPDWATVYRELFEIIRKANADFHAINLPEDRKTVMAKLRNRIERLALDHRLTPEDLDKLIEVMRRLTVTSRDPNSWKPYPIGEARSWVNNN